MADAYLRWKFPDVNLDETQDLPTPPASQPSSATNDPPIMTPSIPNNDPPLPRVPSPTRDDTRHGVPSPSASTEAEILVIDIYSLSTSVKIPCMGDQTTASTLASLGFIGNAPFHPSVAVSVKTLELYRILRRRKPSFSVEAFVKVICDLYMVRMSFVIYSAHSHCDRSHTVPNTVVYFRTRLMHTWKLSESLMTVSRWHSAMTVLTGVY